MNLINNSELLGLGNLPPNAPAKRNVKSAMRAKSGAISTKGATGKAMYERLLHLLPPDIQTAVKAGRLQLVDEILYSVKKIGGFRDHELMESGRLDLAAFVEIRPHSIQHGVAELVVNNVGGQTGVNRVLLIPEIVKLQRLAVAVIEGIFAIARVRDDDEPVAFE